MLNHLGTKKLILTGVAADVCILFTAHDAHLRDYEIVIPSDCVASESKTDTRVALKNMQKSTHALVCRSEKIDFRGLLQHKKAA